MRIEDSRRLRGPNRYLDRPVQVTRVLLDDLTGRETCDFPGLPERLLDLLPGLAEHHCAAGTPGGFVKRLYGGTYFGHTAEHMAIELSNLIGRGVNFGRTVGTEDPSAFDVLMECPVDEPAESSLSRLLLQKAIDVVVPLVRGTEPPALDLEELRRQYEREKPGPSTQAIAEAARARGIPVERVGDLSLLRLGYGRHRRLVWAALTDQTSAIGVDIAADKELTRRLLEDAGVPVPAGGPAATADQAVRLFAQLGAPVVVKPRGGRQGQHVYLGVDSPDAVRAAFAAATADGGDAVVERQVEGRDYRVLTVGGEIVAAAERVPAHVTGDGCTDITGLIARANEDPRRGDGHARALTRLAVDDVAETLLDRQGFTVRDVPAEGATVWLRDNANLSTGGTSVDVTKLVHPSVADLCRRVAGLVGLDIAGIDMRLPDIAEELPLRQGGVIEVNAAPGLRMHLDQHDVGAAIVDALYPAGTPSRIPIVAITGTNGKTTVARLTAHLLAGAGLRVGVTTTDGVMVGGRLIQHADATGPRSARVVLGDPTVDAAVLETARGGLLRQGLGYDWSDVGIITNLSCDHLGQDGIESIDELVNLKSVVAERVREGGAVILNADDPRSSELDFPGREIIWCSLDPRNPLVRRHWDSGGRAYLLADGWLVELTGRRWIPLLAAHELGTAFGGAARHLVANALAATAAARVLGVTTTSLAERLRTFGATPTDNPGRGTLLRRGEVDILLDYAHNPAAIAAVSDLVDRVWGCNRAVAAITLPGDRRDDLLRESATVVGTRFTRVVLYEDADRRGRARGEVPDLVRAELLAVAPATTCIQVETVADAIPAALSLANPGDVVLLLYEKIEPVLALLEALGAHHAGELTTAAPTSSTRPMAWTATG
ncbi:cyanophycin synthetase [Dactylosporangium matsuzakiense]|uniref:Cyanophycin synthetase n=1 Tax=Dactylosporangium matsuzakiense TaxID=53360 RepID=A0A9W6NK73_9ACTN|nr:cyanophycin synthetase [Dactylosporangium matsuzakiense]UWZ44399.1 cyanophycin synthetase [Dactylosporangium matsuzakiense]GLK99441.1 cyanophycin synthetase [Dactylosporangium matsuzakiense]